MSDEQRDELEANVESSRIARAGDMSSSVSIPNCERLRLCSDDVKIITAFIEWLGNGGYTIAKFTKIQDEYCDITTDKTYPITYCGWAPVIGVIGLVYQYHDIDAVELDKERRAILDEFMGKCKNEETK